MEIKNALTYKKNLLLLSGFSLLIPVMIGLIGPDSLPVTIPFFLYIVWYKAKHPFTKVLRINEGRLEVTYMKYFREKTVFFIISDTVLKLHQYHDDVRQPSYHMLDIVVNNKIKYQIDSREGYSKEMLMDLLRGFSQGDIQ